MSSAHWMYPERDPNAMPGAEAELRRVIEEAPPSETEAQGTGSEQDQTRPSDSAKVDQMHLPPQMPGG